MFFVALAAISASSRRRISTQFFSDPTLPLKMGTLLRLINSICDNGVGQGFFLLKGRRRLEEVWQLYQVGRKDSGGTLLLALKTHGEDHNVVESVANANLSTGRHPHAHKHNRLRERTFRSKVMQDAENSCFALMLTVKMLPSMRTCQNTQKRRRVEGMEISRAQAKNTLMLAALVGH